MKYKLNKKNMTQQQLDKIIELNITFRGPLKIMVSSRIDITGLNVHGHEIVSNNQMKGAALLAEGFPLRFVDMSPELFLEFDEFMKGIRLRAFGVLINSATPDGVDGFIYLP